MNNFISLLTTCAILALTVHYAAGITGTNSLGCSPVDDNGYSTFPDYPVDRHQLSDTSVITLSQYLTIYSFTPDTYCRGTIVGADFCFQYPLHENSSTSIDTRLIFEVFRLQRVPFQTLVPIGDSIPLFGFPIDRTSCIEKAPDILHCCERMTFLAGETIPLDGDELLLGILATNNEERYPLLQFSATRPEHFVTAYEVNIGLLTGSTIFTNIYTSSNTLETSEAFPVLRFVVEPDPNVQVPTRHEETTTTISTQPTTEPSSMLGIMSLILYIIIAFLALLCITLIGGLVAAIVKCHVYKKKAKRAHQRSEQTTPHQFTTQMSTTSMGVVNSEYETIPVAYPPPYANSVYSNAAGSTDGEYMKMNIGGSTTHNPYSHTQ